MRLVIPQIFSPANLPRITYVFWLIAKLLCYKVWLIDRLFPVVPVFDFTPGIPGIVHTALFAASVATLLYLLWQPEHKSAMILLLLAEVCSASLDYTRWQPWEYQYLCILFLFIVCTDIKKRQVSLLLLCAALYAYSGIQKFNEGFLTQVWQHMILMPFLKLPHAVRVNAAVHYAGYLIPMAEFLLGLGLLFTTIRRPGIYALIGMHVFNLLWLGPLGANYNIIIWPWNVYMIALLLGLRGYNEALISSQAISRPMIPILALWIVMPVFNFFGRWDHYMSFSLYSGKLPLMAFCTDVAAYPALKPFAKPDDPYSFCDDKSLIKIQSWAMRELNVPPYPQERVYRKLAEILHRNYPGGESLLYFYNNPKSRRQIP